MNVPRRPTHRRPRLVGLLLAAVVAAPVLLAGCSGGSTEGAAGATVPTTAAPAATSTTSPSPSTSTSTSTSTTSTTSTTTSTTTTTTTIPVDPAGQPEPAGPLQAGSVGLRTMALQQALAEQRYDPGTPDGKFGGKTTLAIWAFQALHGLARDGIVTPELEALVLSRPVQPMLRPELGPTHTEVDLTRQVLLVFRDGAPTLISHVSSGSEVAYCEETDTGRNCGDAITPTGLYTYQRRIDGWRDAPLGRLYKPVYFNGGIAVHGAPSVPNHPASHGCVRIPMSIAEYFPSLVADGDAIEVFRS